MAVRTPADGHVTFAVPAVEYLTVHVAFAGRALRGMEGTLEREREVRLVLVPACALRVRVLDDATGVPVEGARVRVVTSQTDHAIDLESSFADEAATDRDGRVVLSCEGGLSNVLVVPQAHAPKLIAYVNVPSEGRELDVRVARGGVVEGRVLAAAGTPVLEARVRLDVRPLYRRDVTTGADGRFRFESVGTDYPTDDELPGGATRDALRERRGARSDAGEPSIPPRPARRRRWR